MEQPKPYKEWLALLVIVADIIRAVLEWLDIIR